MLNYGKHVHLYNQLLSNSEIDEILKEYDNKYDKQFNKKFYRKCSKKVFNNNYLADLVWNRLKQYHVELTVKELDKIWVPFGCSSRIKLIRYNPGDSFNWHVDASTVIDESKVTYSVTIYLNNVPKKNKGATVFKKNTKIPSIQPVKGIAMLINTLYGPEHCGEELKNGIKYILRLDVLSNLKYFKNVKILMKLAIVGSRDFRNYVLLKKTILETLLKWDTKVEDIECIVSGGARGADMLGEIWANKNKLNKKIFKPEWDKYGKGAGIMRNTDIVDESTHMIAFVAPTSRGTWDSIRKAQKKGIPIEIIKV